MANNAPAFLKLVQHPLKFRWFLFAKLPSAFFSGVRVKYMDNTHAVVTVPHTWFSQNPFQSTYFACLAMAAEMSTGLLAMLHTYQSNPAVSMLVTQLEANYFKKAIGITTFTCEEGAVVEQAIQQAFTTNEGQQVQVRSIGLNQQGELVAEFRFTWSFKVKSNKS